ncbi:MAG: hypothetical protein II464_01580, partial [Oscillospiraceae bacterium]|nr:hypothetical protein [Oscillospiraceae bacterium]
TAVNFAYNLANLKAEDLPYLFEELEKNIVDEKTKLTADFLNGKIDRDIFGSRMFKFKKYYLDSLKTAGRIAEGADTSKEEKIVSDMFDSWIGTYGLSDSFEKYSDLDTVYKRNFVGPIQGLNDYRAVGKGEVLDEFDKKMEGTSRFAMYDVESNVVYYIDGKRTLGEVVREVSLDSGTDRKDLVLLFVDTLKKLDLISEV